MDHHDNIDQRVTIQGTAKKVSGKKLDSHRLAKLIASGQVPFPTNLLSPTRETLARQVSQLRRQRLLKFIARAIALDIHRSGETQQKEL